MSDSLFRKEAQKQRQASFLGDVLLVQPLSTTIIVGFVVVVALSVLAFLSLGEYTPRETVQGYLVPDKGIAKLYAPNSATVTTLYVAEGDSVTQNQKLLTATSTRVLEEGADVDSVTLVQLAHMQTELELQMAHEEQLLITEVQKLEKQVQSFQTEYQQVQQQIKTQAERLKIIEKRRSGARQLFEQGHLSEIGLQNYEEEYLNHLQQQEELQRQAISKQTSIDGSEAALAELPHQQASKISMLKNQWSELAQKKAEASGRQQLVLQAPLAGVVTALQVAPGQIIQNSNMLLMSIIPDNTVLYAELFVPTRAMGFIQEGQRVHLRYHAFPHEKFGVQKGHITEITKVVLNPHEMSIPLAIEEPVYRVRVVLEKQDIVAYGESVPLSAGLQLQADIVLEKRSLMEWVLAPLYSFKGRTS